MERSQKVELSMFVLSCALFLGYHAWLFDLRDRYSRHHRQNNFNIWKTNRKARGAWALEISASSTDALQTYAVQTLRNSITASSFLATACSLIAVTGVGNTILDANKVARLESIARGDPALNGGPTIFSATTKLAITEAMILFSFLCLTQSIRLQVHMAFYAKNIASSRNQDVFHENVLIAMSSRSSICFTLGLRAFYAFIPLLMWSAGPCWMLAITVLEVISLIFTDSIPLPKHLPYHEEGKCRESDVEKGIPPTDATNGYKRKDASTELMKKDDDLYENSRERSRSGEADPRTLPLGHVM